MLQISMKKSLICGNRSEDKTAEKCIRRMSQKVAAVIAPRGGIRIISNYIISSVKYLQTFSDPFVNIRNTTAKLNNATCIIQNEVRSNSASKVERTRSDEFM